MKKVILVLLAGAISLAAVLIGLEWFRISSRKKLTAYVAELRAKGERVTFQELASTLTRHTNDSFARFTNLVSKLRPVPVIVSDPAMEGFAGPGRARVRWSFELPPTASTNATTNSSWADWNLRLAEVAPTLLQVRSELEQPALNYGPWKDYWENRVNWQPSRSAVDWLAFAALTSLHDGRLGETLGNIQAIAGLANLHREEFLLASQMTRVAVANSGFRITWEALQADGWNDDQLAALQRCWETQDFLEGLERGMTSERSVGMEILAQWRDGRIGNAGAARRLTRSTRISRVLHERVLENDVVFQLRHLHAQVEAARRLRAGHPFAETTEFFRKSNDEIDQLSKSLTRYLYLITLIVTPRFEKAYLQTARTETHRNLTIAATALRRYQLKYHKPPQDLSTLVPEFLRAVPRDCMDGRPLKYRLNNDGMSTLYSVGDDGKDDGGDAAPGKQSFGTGIWSGRDAVWPTPVWENKPTALQSSTQ